MDVFFLKDVHTNPGPGSTSTQAIFLSVHERPLKVHLTKFQIKQALPSDLMTLAASSTKMSQVNPTFRIDFFEILSSFSGHEK